MKVENICYYYFQMSTSERWLTRVIRLQVNKVSDKNSCRHNFCMYTMKGDARVW